MLCSTPLGTQQQVSRPHHAISLSSYLSSVFQQSIPFQGPWLTSQFYFSFFFIRSLLVSLDEAVVVADDFATLTATSRSYCYYTTHESIITTCPNSDHL
jgi:hypothetical protein